jgi:hypothetical protein
MAKRQMSMLSFIPDHIKKSKVEEIQSHHAFDRDDKRKINDFNIAFLYFCFRHCG